MPGQTRLGDNDTGHDACPPRPLASGSPDVIVNGQKAGRVGVDNYAVHGCVVHAPHSAVVASGSKTVFINGAPAARIGDPVSCGSSVAVGSGNVIVGD